MSRTAVTERATAFTPQRDRPPSGRRSGACRSHAVTQRHQLDAHAVEPLPDPPQFGGERGERVGRRSGGHVRMMPR
jgi:hypothetical protein